MEDQRLIVFFLYEDEGENVLVEEVEDLNLPHIIQHLNHGGSVFITHRRKPRRNVSSAERRSERNLEEPGKPWHFISDSAGSVSRTMRVRVPKESRIAIFTRIA